MDFWPWFWQSLGNFANALQIITVVAAVYAAVRLWQQNRKLRDLARKTPPMDNLTQLIEFNNGVKSVAPIALAFSLLDSGESIKQPVSQFLNASKMDMEIIEVTRKGLHSQADREWYVNELRRVRALLQNQGVTEVHVFFAGPVQAAALFGSLMDNWIPVKLYQRLPSGSVPFYEYWMPLL